MLGSLLLRSVPALNTSYPSDPTRCLELMSDERPQYSRIVIPGNSLYKTRKARDDGGGCGLFNEHLYYRKTDKLKEEREKSIILKPKGRAGEWVSCDI